MQGRKKSSFPRFSLGTFPILLKAAIRKIPSIIWGAFAVFGIFFFGLFMGFAVTDVSEEELIPNLSDNKSEQYLDVIDSYQEVSQLYYYQQQDMDIVIDINSWQDNPEEVYEAISSYKQKRDEILFQLGRIYEVRKKAGLQTPQPE